MAGADEFAGIALDLDRPLIGLYCTGHYLCTGKQDADRHDHRSALGMYSRTKPRIYFKKSGNLIC